MAKKKRDMPLRAAGYCRTSSEGQRDNTSIPTQKEHIERKMKANGWTFVRHYVDESKSGSRIEGRDEFQRMMRDAANGDFDIVVVYDLSRFGRSGADIIECAQKLKRACNVDLLETSGGFDSSDDLRIVSNFTLAGVTEYIRRLILKNTINGRIARAREGKPWSCLPIGRNYDKASGRWYVTDKGRSIAEALHRYLQGEGLTELCQELGLGHRKKISEWVAHGQLSGTYVARFQSPDLGIDEAVEVSVIPPIVERDVLSKVRARLLHNRRFNRTDVSRYVLSGFIRCDCCGKALTGQTDTTSGQVYYRHKATPECSIVSVRGDAIEPAVLEYLYGRFLDRPAFEEAVAKAMPTAEVREAKEGERNRTTERLAKVETELARLIDAIMQGAHVSILTDKQDELLAAKSTLVERLAAIDDEIATMPSAERLAAAANYTRTQLMLRYWQHRDWRKLPIEEIKPFLFHLFGETNPTSRNGVSVGKNEYGQLVATFRGNLAFDAEFHDGQILSKLFLNAADRMNARLRRDYDRAMASLDAEYGDSVSELAGALKPFPALSKGGPVWPGFC